MNKGKVNFIGNYSLIDAIYANSEDMLNKEVDYSKYTNYSFKIDTKLHKKLKVGDLVVIHGNDGKLKVVKISVIHNDTEYNIETLDASNKANAWVVDKVRLKAHLERINNSIKAKFISQQIDDRSKVVKMRKDLEELAKSDEKLSKLLKQLKFIGE